MSRRSHQSRMNLRAKLAADQTQDAQGNTLGYANGLTKETAANAFNSSAFVQDVYDYYYERDGKRFTSVDEAKDYFMDDRRYKNVNTLGIAGDVFDSKAHTDAQKGRLARLQTTFDAMPNFYEEGGDGWAGFGANAFYAIADPINLVGFGAGGAAARAAAAGVMATGGKEILKRGGSEAVKRTAKQATLVKEAKRAGFIAGVKKGATSEAIASGAVGGIHDAMIQTRNMEVGMQDKYSFGRAATAIGLGAGIGGMLGGGFGAVGAVMPNINPLAKGWKKGNSNIGAGIIEGKATAYRKDLNLRREQAAAKQKLADEAEVISTTLGTPENKARLVEAIKARAALQRSNEQSADLDAMDNTNTVKVNDPNKVELTPSQRMDNAVNAMQSASRIANEYRKKAEAVKDDLAKSNELEAQAAKHEQIADQIETTLYRIDDPKNATTDSDILLLTNQTALLSYDPTVGNAADNTMDPFVGDGFTGQAGTVGPGREAAAAVDMATQRATGADAVAVGANRENITGGVEPSDTTGELLSVSLERERLVNEAKTQAELERLVGEEQKEFDRLQLELEDATTAAQAADNGLTKEVIDDGKGGQVTKVTNDVDSPEVAKAREANAAVDAAQLALNNQSGKITVAKKATSDAADAAELRRKDQADVDADLASQKAAYDANLALFYPDNVTDTPDTPEIVIKSYEDTVEDIISGVGDTADVNPASKKPSYLLDVLNSFYETSGQPDAAALSAKAQADMKAAVKGMAPNSKARKAKTAEMFREKMNEMVGIVAARVVINGAEENNVGSSLYDADVFDILLNAALQKLNNGDPATFKSYAMAEYNAWSTKQAQAMYDNLVYNDAGMDDASARAAITTEYGADFANLTEEAQFVEFTPAKNAEIQNFIRELPSILGKELGQISEQYLAHALRTGVTIDEAKRLASKVMMAKAEKWMRNQENFSARNQEAIDFDINANRQIKREFEVALNNLFTTLKPSLEADKQGKAYANALRSKTFTLKGYDFDNILASPGGDPVGQTKGAKRVRYTIQEGRAAAPAQEAHMQARALIASLIRKHGFKDNMTVAQINDALEKQNLHLQKLRKKEIFVNNNQDTRVSVDISVSEEVAALKNADYIGRKQNAATGKITYYGKTLEGTGITQGQMSAVFGTNKGGGVYTKKTYRDAQTGNKITLDAQTTALGQILSAATEAGTGRIVRNEIKAKRQLPLTEPRTKARKDLEKLARALDSAENPKATDKNPNPVVDPAKVQKAKDALNAKYSELRIATFEVKFPETVDGQQIISQKSISLVDISQIEQARSDIAWGRKEYTAEPVSDAAAMARALKDIVTDLNKSTDKEAKADAQVDVAKKIGLVNLQTEYNILKNRIADALYGKLIKVDGKMVRQGDRVAMDEADLLAFKKQLTILGRTIQGLKDNNGNIDPNAAAKIIEAPSRKLAKGKKIEAARTKQEGDQATRDAAQEASYNARRGGTEYDDVFGEGDPNNPVGVTDSAETQAFNNAVAAALNNRTGSGAELTPEDYALLGGFEYTPEVKSAVNKKADEIMNEQGASSDMQADIADALKIKRQFGFDNAWLNARVAEIQGEYKAKTGPATTPTSQPHTPTGRAPYMRVIDGIEIDMFNDLQYVDMGKGVTAVKFEGFTLGRVETMSDGKVTFQKSSGGDLRVYANRLALIDDLLPMFRASFNKVADAQPGKYKRKLGQEGLSYPTKTNTSQTYSDPNAVTTPVDPSKKGVTPLDNPSKPVDPADIFTHNGEHYGTLIPVGKKLALQFTSGKYVGTVRGTSESKPQNLGEMLKKSRNIKFIVGHVDIATEGVSAAQQRVDTFRPMDPNQNFHKLVGGKLEWVSVAEADAADAARGAVVPTAATKSTKKQQAAVDLDKVAGNEVKGAEAHIATLQAMAPNALRSVGELNNLVFNLENVNWSKLSTLENFKQFLNLRAAAGALLNSSVPTGIKRDTADHIRNTTSQLKNILSEHAPDDLAASVTFLENLYNFTGKAPLIEVGEKNQFAPSYTTVNGVKFGKKDRNRITLDEAQIKSGDDRVQPVTVSIIHETAHWLYANVLSEKDKTIFWDAMNKFYKSAEDEGTLDLDLLVNGSVDPQLMSNSMASPAEYFANQFVTWVTTNGQVNNISLWQKISQLGATLLNNLLGREGAPRVEIDADLVPIFQQYMPVLKPDPVTGRMNVGLSRFAHLQAMGQKYGKASAQGKAQSPAAFIGGKIAVLDTERLKLTGAKMRTPGSLDDSLSFATDLEAVGKKMYGMFGGRQGEGRHYYNPAQEGSGNARVTMFDGKPALNSVMKAQYAIHEFLATLRATKRSFNKDVEETDTGNAEILKLIEGGGTVGEATEMKIRQDSAYDGLDDKIVQHLDMLATDMNNSIDAMVKEMLKSFNRNMPRDDTGQFAAVLDTGATVARKPNKNSEKFKKLAALNAATRISKMNALQKIIADFDEASKDLATVPPEVLARMVDEEAVPVTPYEKLERTVLEKGNIADVVKAMNALGAKADLSTVPTMAELFAEAVDLPGGKEILTSILRAGDKRDVLRSLADKATQLGQPVWIQIALRWKHEPANMGIAHRGLPKVKPVDGDMPPSALVTKGLLTHRKFEVQEVMGDLFDKLFKLGLRGVDEQKRTSTNAKESFSEYDAYVITGKGDPDADANAEFETALDTDSELFKGVRKELRSIATQIVRLNDARKSTDNSTKGLDARGEYLSKNLYSDLMPRLYMMGYRMLGDKQKDVIEKASRVMWDIPGDNVEVYVTYALRRLAMGKEIDVRSSENILREGISNPKFPDEFKELAVADPQLVKKAMEDIDATINTIKQDLFAFPKDEIQATREMGDLNRKAEDKNFFDGGEVDLFLLLPTKEEARIIKAPVLMAVKAGDGNVPPVVANRYARELVSSMSERVQSTVRTFLGASPFDNMAAHLRFNKSPDVEVNGVTVTRNGPYGDGVYTSRAAEADDEYNAGVFLDEATAKIEAAGLSRLDTESGMASVDAIINYRERMLDLMNRSQDQNGVVNHELKHLMAQTKTHWAHLNELVPSMVEPVVLPVFARISNPFDLTSTSNYSLRADAQDGIAFLVRRMVDENVLNFQAVQQLMDGLPDVISGKQLHEKLTADSGIMVRNDLAGDGDAARSLFSSFIERQGYDALTTDIGDVVFDSSAVKRAEGGFTEVDVGYSTLPSLDTSRKIGGLLAEEMAVTNGELANGRFANLIEEAQHLELPVPLTSTLGKMFKKQDLSDDDVQKVSKFSSVRNFFAENSAHFRNIGANWYADKIKPTEGTGFYEAHDATLSNTINSVFRELEKLPDAGGRIGKWANRNRGLMLKDPKQPESHKRIIAALRRGRGAVEELNPAEKKLALKIGKTFDAELQKMRALGIAVGDARALGSDFYIPQVWDGEAILANPKRFKKALVDMMKREQDAPDYLGQNRKSMDELSEIAENVSFRLTKGHDPSVDEHVQRAFGDVFAPRVLQLQPADMPELEKFLVTDLQGIMSKYFDRTVRKRLLTEEFGLNLHGFDTYLDVARGTTLSGKGNALDRAVEILRSTKHTSAYGGTKEGPLQVDKVSVPPVRGRADELKELLVAVERELGDTADSRVQGKQRAKAMLINAAEGQDRSDVQYNIRVDAIVNALVDYPKSNRLNHQNEGKMRDMMNVLNKRSIDGGDGSELRYVVSRNMKAFNAVSLLGFTTLTSMPDMVLPLIRSGDMGAFTQAWRGFIKKDPAYRDAARNIGVGIENLMHDRAVQQTGQGNQKFTNSFFNLTGLTAWTNFNREVSAMVGFESFKTEISRALSMRANGQSNSRAYQTSVRYLKRYGLTGDGAEYDFLAYGAMRLDDLPPADERIAKQVQMSMIRFTNESVFMPNPNDTPLPMQNPWQSMIWQLKSFPLMMSRLGGYVASEARQGNVKPAVYLMTAGVGMGMVSVMAKDVVQARGGEDETSMALRIRYASEKGMNPLWPIAKMLGATDESMTDRVVQTYWEGLLALGGLGLFGELLYNSASQLDNGAYGSVRQASLVGGPGVSTFFDGVNVVAGLSDAAFGDEDGGNAKQRTMYRSIFGRIPVGGGVAAFKEGATDTMAGEAAKKGPKKKGKFDGSFSSKFNSAEFGSGFD